ncbi:MAG: hypothetical protein ABJC89_08075 [Acidobacteriota bacterium]
MNKILGMMLIGVALASTGCLQQETTHTLYLNPDGGVRWMAIEKDVRSDERDPSARRSEEETYLASAAAGTHDLGRAFAALAPTGQRTRILRAQRPFIVITEAEFPGVRELFERLLEDLRVPGQVTMTHAGGLTTLRIHADMVAARSDDGERDSPVVALCEELAAFRFVLTSGRFVSAEGFTLSDDGTTATIAESLAAQEVSLGWKLESLITDH